MPTNKNAVIRYMILDELLSDQNHYYTCNDLFDIVNRRLRSYGYMELLDKRVIQLDINALQDSPFYMEIECVNKTGAKRNAPNYRYADPTQRIFNKKLSDDEKRLLQEVLNTLGQFSGLDNFEWLDDLQKKLRDPKAFGRTKFESERLQKRKIISFSSCDYLTGKNHLAALFSLIASQTVVDVKYAPFGGDERIIRLYPYLLKQYNDRWYLIGTPTETKEFPYRKDFYINLPLDRMREVCSVSDIPYIDCDDDIEERFEDIMGITYNESEPITEILLAVKDSETGYVDTKPLHGSQVKLSLQKQEDLHSKYTTLNGYTFYKLELKPNRELYNQLYSYGDGIVLVEPVPIRNKMIEEMTRSLERFKSISSI